MVNWSQGIISKNERLTHPLLLDKGVELYVKREDLIHTEISGNKWRKLKYHMIKALNDGECQGLLTKGGAYSNHILATASAAASAGLKSKAFIRGERVLPLNLTLSRCKDLGMEFIFIDRSSYRQSIHELAVLHGIGEEWMLIPEGGTSTLGIKGCQEILSESDKEEFDLIAVSFGTGGTAAGVLSSLKKRQKLLVFSSLKGLSVSETIGQIIGNDAFQALREQLIAFEDYHFGGYAKLTTELIDFMREFEGRSGIPLDPVYTAKLFFGLFDLIDKRHFPIGSKVLAIHTGGLQGRRGMEERLGIEFSAKA